MGEEKKEEKKEEVKKEETKEEEKKDEKKEEEPPEIVLKVDMHCEACARKVAKALKGFEGVEDVTTDIKASKVVVKGKTADPVKVCVRLQKKSGRKVELISPLPKPPEEKKEEEKKEEKEVKKEEPPAVATVVLTVPMHCEACAHALKKKIQKIRGVEAVETDLANHQVVVKGVIEPEKLVDSVYKRTKKLASIVKNEEKKEEEKKEEKKEEKEEEKKEGEEAKGGVADAKMDMSKSEYWPSRYYMDYAYPPPQIFSDENPNACSVM